MTDEADTLTSPASREMEARADEAARFLKLLAHEGRLMLLCYLADGEKTVGTLERLLGARQPVVSQQLARLRVEGLVRGRRDGKTIHYSITDQRVARMIATLYEMFCSDDSAPPQAAGGTGM